MKKFFVPYCVILLFAMGMTLHVKANEPRPRKVKTEYSIAVQEINIYPNPAIDFIFLKFENAVANQVSIEIRSFIGNEMVFSSVVQQSNLIKLDITELPAGHYYAVISLDQEKTLKKFIKRA